MSLPSSLNIVTAGPVRAAASARELAWTLVGNLALHASLIAVASIIPVRSAAWIFSTAVHNPPSGDNTVRLSAAFLDASAASPAEQAEVAPSLVMLKSPVPTDGMSEIAPRKIDITPLGTLPASQDAMADADSREEAAAQGKTTIPDKTRREPKESLPEVADAPTELSREVTSKLPAEANSVPSQATAAASAPPASGAPDALPTELHSPFPAYPPELLARRIQATVVLRLRIAADGTVAEATVHRTSGYAAMDQAALAGVKSWKFKPALKNGTSVETLVLKPFTFEIRD